MMCIKSLAYASRH